MGAARRAGHPPQAVGIEPATYDRALVEQRATLTIGPPAERRLTDFEYFTSPLLVRDPHYTHVYLLHAVYSQTLLAC